MPKRKYIQIENKNAIIELMEEGKEFERIFVGSTAFKDHKTRHIVSEAGKRGIPMEKVTRRALNRRSKVSSSESIIALMHIDNQYSLDGFIDQLFERKEDPFVIIFGDITYPHNIGAIFRTAFAAGVNGIVTPIDKGNLLTDEIMRISMGTALRIPIVEASLFAAIKRFKKEAIEVMALSMEGQSMYKSNLTGPKAFILGSEDTGVSSKLIERSDKTVSIPMKPGLGSLNVSVSAAVLMYEKVRQDLSVK